MALQKFSNNAYSTLAGDINDTVTALSVASAPDGDLFPAITGTTNYFYATLIDTSNNKEIVKVTDRAGAAFTIERGQDGTTARAFATGDRVELRITNANLDNFLQKGINDSAVSIGDAAGTDRHFNAYTDEELRWSFGADDAAESGSQAGSDFEVVRYDDDGVEVDSPVTIARASGVVTFAAIPVYNGNNFDSFEAGVSMVFRQATVPTGWTKETGLEYENAAFRLTTGTLTTGGTANFTDVLKSWTLLEANLPAHTHTFSATTSSDSHSHTYAQRQQGPYGSGGGGSQYHGDNATSNKTSSSDAHTHSVSGTTSSVGSATALDFAAKYVDFYVATKD